MLEERKVTVPALTGDEERRAWVYVPDSAWADRERRYPVLYMFDGQNLFRDEDATYGKSWGLLDYLTEHNVPLIVAAVECNKHAEDEPCGGRLSEYSPFDISFGDWGDIKGRGELTMDFLINDFKPRIDEEWPTKPDREHSFIVGSSMGGLMTLYALMAYNDTFSRGAALSPSLDFDPERVKAMIREARIAKTVLYMDMGQQELKSRSARKTYADVTARLLRKGVLLDSRIVPDGFHSEASWERQIPFFMDTLLYNMEE